nr:uncharacterized protein LOC112210333 [Halyomorpha halys]
MDFRKDGKKAHAFISRINGEKIIEYEPIKIGNKLVTTEKDIAEVFCKNYCKISNVTIPEKIKNQDLLENPGCLNLDNSMLFCSPFSKLELDVALSKLKMGKSAGPDGLLPEFLKNLGEKAKDILLRFINFTWKSHVPAQWKKAEVLPILKNGKPADDINRPISLTSTLCKLVE